MHVETQEALNSEPFVSYCCAFPGTLQNWLEEGTLTIFFEWSSIGTACTTHAKRRPLEQQPSRTKCSVLSQ